MDCGILLVLGVVCGRYGPRELCLSPPVDAQTALYGGLLWVHYNDVGFCH